MVPPVWDDSWNVNVRELDGQHRMLATLICDLHDALKYARSLETINGVFDEVVEYTEYHFAAEERLMRDSRFPGYLLHKAVHDDARLRLADLRERFEQGGRAAVSAAAFEFMRDWLLSHIEVEDQAIARHLLAGETARLPEHSVSIH